MITAMMVWCLSKGLLNGNYVTGGIIADIILAGMFFSFISDIVKKSSKKKEKNDRTA